MMNFTREVSLAIDIVNFLYNHNRKTVSAEDVSKHLDSPLSTIQSAMTKLAKDNILSSIKGRNGGASLLNDGVNLSQIIHAIHGIGNSVNINTPSGKINALYWGFLKSTPAILSKLDKIIESMKVDPITTKKDMGDTLFTIQLPASVPMEQHDVPKDVVQPIILKKEDQLQHIPGLEDDSDTIEW